MLPFLARTPYCDWDRPDVRAAVVYALDGTCPGRSAAVRLFRFVRDSVLYAFGPWDVSASHTLAQREGSCSNKNNLLIAMLRAAGIPAAYGVLRVNPLEYYGNLTPAAFRSLRTLDTDAPSTHIYAAAFIDGSWVKCDASTDSDVAKKTAHFCRQTRLVDWDGRHDAMDALDPKHVYADLGLRPNVDDLLAKPARNAIPEKLAILNDYLRFIRSEPPFPTADALLEGYLNFLQRRSASS